MRRHFLLLVAAGAVTTATSDSATGTTPASVTTEASSNGFKKATSKGVCTMPPDSATLGVVSKYNIDTTECETSCQKDDKCAGYAMQFDGTCSKYGLYGDEAVEDSFTKETAFKQGGSKNMNLAAIGLVIDGDDKSERVCMVKTTSLPKNAAGRAVASIAAAVLSAVACAAVW